MATPKVHHSAICVRDVEESLRFYRDGLGLTVTMDEEFDGDWPGLFGAEGTRLRSVFLGDPDVTDAGFVELVSFTGGMAAGAPLANGPTMGFFLLSLYVEVGATLERLAKLGLGGAPRRIAVAGAGGGNGVVMATVRDPDGVQVELIGLVGA
jgi:catechol 2,3-dioxygenase-like lactoylglutathione lyase family enzyme